MDVKKSLKKIVKSDDFPLLVIAGVSLGLSVLAYKVNFPGSFSSDHTRWAEFGGYIGGVIGASFAVLVFFILIRQLRVNQQELTETRTVIEKQNFESTFLQLLNQLDTELSKARMDIDRTSIRELKNSIEEVIIVRKQSGLLNAGPIIEKVICEKRSYLILKPLIEFLHIFLEFIASNLNKKISSEIHTRLFISKLSDDQLFILVATALAQTKNEEIRMAISQCELIKHIEIEESRGNLKALFNS